MIIPDPQDINGQFRQKVMTLCIRNELCQRPKTSFFDFVFPFTFKNEHRFESFFALIMEGIGMVLCNFFEFELSQNYRDVTVIISHSVSILLMNAS